MDRESHSATDCVLDGASRERINNVVEFLAKIHFLSPGLVRR